MDYKEKVIALLSGQELSNEQKEKLENIFPELKEDNDEMVRKGLIKAVSRIFDGNKLFDTDVTKEQALAWLEKQGKRDARYEYLEKLLEADTEYQIAMNDAMVEEAKTKAMEAVSNMCIFELLGLEKQGEQPTDKVESKFKVGDWLQYRHAEPFLVEKITEQGYCNGDSCLLFEWEDEIHLWTVNDAQDGDVLVTTSIRNCPFIYRKTDNNNNLAYFYAGVNGNGNFCEGCLKRTLCHFGSVANVTPATKEQQDFLFAKMREAGYEWDAEKKELKKIEPKLIHADFWNLIKTEH